MASGRGAGPAVVDDDDTLMVVGDETADRHLLGANAAIGY